MIHMGVELSVRLNPTVQEVLPQLVAKSLKRKVHKAVVFKEKLLLDFNIRELSRVISF